MRAVTATPLSLPPPAAAHRARHRHVLPRVSATSSSSSSSMDSNLGGVGGSMMDCSSMGNAEKEGEAWAGSTIQFLTLCQRLKTTKRAGWVNHGLKNTESIADHMYRMAIMAVVAGEGAGVNKERCVKMAVVHDLAEAIVGDITPSDGVPKEEKSRRESEAMDAMCAMLGGGAAAREMKELWVEYEANATAEAKLVKDFDKLEMILQAQEYEEAQGKHLEDFFRTTKGQFQTEVGKALAAEVVRRRPFETQPGGRLPADPPANSPSHLIP